MRFDTKTTGLLFVGVVVLATVAMTFTPMTSQTIYMMVLPSMVVYGLLMLWLGTKLGEHNASA